MRALFTREFSFSKVAILWDALFAYTTSLYNTILSNNQKLKILQKENIVTGTGI